MTETEKSSDIGEIVTHFQSFVVP